VGVERTSFAGMHCSIARTLEIIGEWWTPLILRDAFLGLSRFEEFQGSLGIARNVLTKRLTTLVQEGIMERHRYQEHPERFEYRLTEAGRELFPIVVSLLHWGDRWTAGEAGPPLLLVHEPCGQPAAAMLVCSHCGEEITLDNVHPQLGPGAA
jgi:DNA-binding HxlR family transcriptional regulator